MVRWSVGPALEEGKTEWRIRDEQIRESYKESVPEFDLLQVESGKMAIFSQMNSRELTVTGCTPQGPS